MTTRLSTPKGIYTARALADIAPPRVYSWPTRPIVPFTLTAAHAGICSACAGPFAAGDTILKQPGKKAAHVDCGEQR